MGSSVYCQGCGQKLVIPEDYERNKMRCPQCGVMCDLPSPSERKPKPPAGERKTKPAPKPEIKEKPSPKNTAIQPKAAVARTVAPKATKASTPKASPAPPRPKPTSAGDDDDGQPYTVSGGEERKCPDCGKLLEDDAVLCLRCGLNTETGEQAKQTFQPLERHWENGWSFQARLTTFIICEGVALSSGLIAVIFLGSDACTYVTSGVTFTLMLSFLLGTWDSLDLERNQKGRVRLTKTWRVCFVTTSVTKINLGEYQGVLTGRTHDVTVSDWVIFFILFTWAIIPGLIFAYNVIFKQTFYVALMQDHGHAAMMLYRGGNENQMKEIQAIVTDCGRWKVDVPQNI